MVILDGHIFHFLITDCGMGYDVNFFSFDYLSRTETKEFSAVLEFVSVRTGQIITRKKFTSLPMPQSVIKKWKIWPSRKTTKKNLFSRTKTGTLLRFMMMIPQQGKKPPQEWIMT